MAADGSDVRSVAPSVATFGFQRPLPWNLHWLPAWSPDGRSLAFIADIQSHFIAEHDPRAFRSTLFTVGVDGANLARLGETASAPAWSPDGSRIAFVRHDSEFYVRQDDDDGMGAILSVAPDGSDLTVVFDYGNTDVVDIRPFNNLSWSPDGSKILFSGLGRRVVGVVNADGSNPRPLASVRRADNATWSPDGSSIAVYNAITADGYSSRPTDMASDVPDFNVVLFTMKADGSDKRILARYNRDPGGRTGSVVEAGGESWYTEYEGRYFKLHDGPYIELKPPDSAPMPSGSVPPLPAQEGQGAGKPETPPCAASSGDACVTRDVSGFDIFLSGSGSAAYGHEATIGSVEDVLEKGLFLLGASPVHIDSVSRNGG